MLVVHKTIDAKKVFDELVKKCQKLNLVLQIVFHNY